MQIKLTYYNLASYYEPVSIVPGLRVCPSNGAKSIGVITHIGKISVDRWNRKLPIDVTVLWTTGNKRGKQSVNTPDTLTAFDAYMAAVKSEYDKLDTLSKEALRFGL